MTRKYAALVLTLFVPTALFAQSVGTCGWGSKLFDGQRGIAPQVLAVTTNGSTGNETFGISSGTSGCVQDGVVRSAWKTALFIDANMNRLARESSQGSGEALSSLASLMNVSDQDRPRFFSTIQSNFGTIFPRSDVSAMEVRDSLRHVLAADQTLNRYAHMV
jgi:hypothetical protein